LERSSTTFWRNILPPSSGVENKPSKQPAINSFSLLLTGYLLGLPFNDEDRDYTFLRNVGEFYWTAWLHIPEDSSIHS
jgi:hypothetical protein